MPVIRSVLLRLEPSISCWIHLSSLIKRQVHAVKRIVLRFNEGFKTGSAVITLITFAIFAALLGFVLAVMTYHIVSLAFLWRLAHNVFAEN